MIEPRHLAAFGFRQVQEERIIFPFGFAQRRHRLHVDGFMPRVGAVLGRAHIDAQIAARAVLGRDLDRVSFVLEIDTFVGRRHEGCRSIAKLGRVVDFGADRRVRTNQRTHVALDADRRVPDWNLESDGALLPFAGGHGPCAVDGEGAHWQQISFAGHHHCGDFCTKSGACSETSGGRLRLALTAPGSGISCSRARV